MNDGMNRYFLNVFYVRGTVLGVRESGEQDAFQVSYPHGIEPKAEHNKINTYYLGWDLGANESPGVLILF